MTSVSAYFTTEEDYFSQVKALQRQEEFLDIQEEYIKDEMRNLKRELIRAKEELKKIQSVPLMIGQFNEMIDTNYGVVNSTDKGFTLSRFRGRRLASALRSWLDD